MGNIVFKNKVFFYKNLNLKFKKGHEILIKEIEIIFIKKI